MHTTVHISLQVITKPIRIRENLVVTVNLILQKSRTCTNIIYGMYFVDFEVIIREGNFRKYNNLNM